MIRVTIRDVLEPPFLRIVVGCATVGALLAGLTGTIYLNISEPPHSPGDVIQSTGQQDGIWLIGIIVLGVACGALLGTISAAATLNRP